ncbi:histidinolphosphatase [Scheffersomyces xylosifermentans]|uniref:histidinolphosphatase n=1 Tax=Scheffersomyces xylosifermentans TaxID=1304137 RepID=UPI00315DCD1C
MHSSSLTLSPGKVSISNYHSVETLKCSHRRIYFYNCQKKGSLLDIKGSVFRPHRMHSHHSHSGDYVSHASDSLDSIVELAASKGFEIFCLTEHMPRLDAKFIYPEESDKNYSVDHLSGDFARYLQHAERLQNQYNSHSSNAQKHGMKLIIGFEVEGIDESHISYAKGLLLQNKVINMTVGSVHFVHQIPIDFSPEQWLEAREATKEKTTRALFRDYFELQYKVITGLKPQVVGHFDLIRLLQPKDEVDPETGKLVKDIDIEKEWPEVWTLIVRNIQEVASYGGLFELNSSAIRKGWDTPYPKKDISKAIIEHGEARFCLSDDSHGLKQVGLNFHKTWKYVTDDLQLEWIYRLDLDENNQTIVKKEAVKKLSESDFWKQYEVVEGV